MYFDDIIDGQLKDCNNLDGILDESKEKIKINMAYITKANFKKIITNNKTKTTISQAFKFNTTTFRINT